MLLSLDQALTVLAPPTTPSSSATAFAREVFDAARASPREIVVWAVEQFGDRLVMSSSFGAQSAAMLHLVTRVMPDIPVVLVDTGYLFAETYQFAQQLEERLGLNLHVVSPATTAARLEATRGELWSKGPEGLAEYHQVFKIEPMQRALRDLGAEAWIAGLRGDQSSHRQQLQPIDQQDGLTKIHPILRWKRSDVGRYMSEHKLPYHPLVAKGYASIGDRHSTRPVSEHESERAGRFGGKVEECGLHVPQSLAENEAMESAGL